MKGLYYWLDLRDKNGVPDHQKIMPTIIIAVAAVAHFVRVPFNWIELTILGSIAFGPRMFGLFLRRSNFGFTGTYNEVYNRRDPTTGEEPT